MVAWVSVEALLLYIIVFISLFLSLMAVVYAYRLSRITGLFSAWILLIAALALTALEDIAFFGSVVFVSYSKLETQVQTYTWGSFLFEFLILVCIPLLFFSSMYRLHHIFRLQKSGERQSG